MARGESMRLILKQHDARREAVDEVLAADRAELAGGEEAGERDRARLLLDRLRVVVRPREEARPSAVAAEEQGPRGMLLMSVHVHLEQGAEVLVGRLGVADMELDRLADA